MHVQSTNQQLVGGIHLEIWVRMTHMMDAVNHMLEHQQFKRTAIWCQCTIHQSNNATLPSIHREVVSHSKSPADLCWCDEACSCKGNDKPGKMDLSRSQASAGLSSCRVSYCGKKRKPSVATTSTCPTTST